MSKDAYVREESSRQRRRRGQKSCGTRAPGRFRALKKAGVAGAVRGVQRVEDGIGEAKPGRVGTSHIGSYRPF